MNPKNLLITVLALTLFAGCGKKDEEAPANNQVITANDVQTAQSAALKDSMAKLEEEIQKKLLQASEEMRAEVQEQLGMEILALQEKLEKILSKLEKHSHFTITLEKAALDKTFLMTAAQIKGAPAPSGNSMASKIVYFKKAADGLRMYESLDGKLSTNSLPTEAPLANFPIVKEDDSSITFDFKKGMNLVYMKRSLFTTDFGGGKDPGDAVAKITHNFINKIEPRGKFIFIDQIVRLDSGSSNSSLHLKYTLSPYEKSATFKAKKSNKVKRVGYFEVHPVLTAGSGESTVRIMKFDENKPIVYHMTRNIPKEFQQAVIDGVLYWNTVFGKDILKVETLPEGINAHEPGYNILQWLSWDTAGFAYADMQADPMTGEILQSHVYMTSVFGKGGLKRAKRIYKQLMSRLQEAPKHNHIVGPEGFEAHHTCKFDINKSVVKDLGSLINMVEEKKEELKEEGQTLSVSEEEQIFARFASDYVRQVVAHEIGHTLGLRHNFAGSIQTNITPRLYPTVSKTYFLTGELIDGMIPGGTVMDYTPAMVSSMIGAHIRLKRKALTYDQQAITFGYTDIKLADLATDTFCTDSQRGKFDDCKIWDRFKSPVDGAYTDWKDSLESRAFLIANKFSFLSEKEKLSASEINAKIKSTSLDPAADAKKIVDENLALVMKMLSPKASFVAVREQFPESITVIEADEYKSKTKKHQEMMAERIGGVSKALLTEITPVETEEGMKLALTASMKQDTIDTLKKLYKDQITDEELEAISKRTNKYFEYFEKELLYNLTKKLSSTELALSDDKWSDSLINLAEKILFAKSEKVVGTSSNDVKVYEPTFQYVSDKKDLRKEVAGLVKHNFYPKSSRYLKRMGERGKKLYEKHDEQVKAMLEGTTEDDLSDELFEWLKAEKARFSGLK